MYKLYKEYIEDLLVPMMKYTHIIRNSYDVTFMSEGTVHLWTVCIAMAVSANNDYPMTILRQLYLCMTCMTKYKSIGRIRIK